MAFVRSSKTSTKSMSRTLNFLKCVGKLTICFVEGINFFPTYRVDFQPNSMFTSKYLTFSTVNPYVIFFDTINFRMEFRKKSNARNVFAKIAPKPSEKNQNNENCIHFSSLSNACTNFYWIQRKIVKLLCKRNIPKYLFKSFSKEKNSLKTQFPNDPLT